MKHAQRPFGLTGSQQVCVVGAGIAGLTAATLLAVAGAQVTLIDKADACGGKARSYVRAGYRFNYGPSTFTLLHLFHNVIAAAGLPPDTLVTAPLVVNHRNHFADGNTIDSVTDSDRMRAQIARVAPHDERHWQPYLADADRLLRLSGTFFRRSLSKRGDYLSPTLLAALLRVHPLTTLSTLHARHFQDERIRMMLDRYATYVGGRPEATAATLAMIAAIEYGLGVHHIVGGGAGLVAALEQAARHAGVDIRLRTTAERVVHQGGRVAGIIANDDQLPADAVVLTADALGEGLRMAGDALSARYRRTLAQLPLSLSGFAMLLGAARQWPHLHHHNVFFPPRYANEFASIFDCQALAEAPTMYVCWSGYSEPGTAPPGGSNLFVLVNAPAARPRLAIDAQAWRAYGDRIIELLEQRAHLSGLASSLQARIDVTPADLRDDTGAADGAIYGPSPHGVQGFLRPRIRPPGAIGLYFAGGTVHPGGGTPMAAISAWLAARLVARQLGLSEIADILQPIF